MGASVLPILLNVIRDTEQYFQSFNTRPPPTALTTSSPTIPFVCLPDPPPLYLSLIGLGADARVAKEMDRVYSARALELRSYYENAIRNAFMTLADSPLPDRSEKRILENFRNLYLTKTKSWITDSLNTYKAWADSDRSHKHRPSFNTDYIPLLEHFFEENPLPTHADKVFLAKKTGMTYRQIHVWFQNRRNRTKKLNRTWKKKPTSEGATVPLDALRERMKKYVNSSHYDQVPLRNIKPRSTLSYEWQVVKDGHLPPEKALHHAIPTEKDNVLNNLNAPPHAFPLPYALSSTCSPFYTETCSQLPSGSEWLRRPNHSPVKTAEINADELADLFSLLTVRDTHPKLSQRDDSLLPSAPAATLSITVWPSPAPHPALVKPTAAPLLPRIHSLPIIRASQPTPEVFTSSIIPSVLAWPSIHLQDTSFSWRKYSPLPKRYPQSHRAVTPPTSEVSCSSPSPSSSLRSLTGSSDFERLDPVPVPAPDLDFLLSLSHSPHIDQVVTCG